MIPVQRLNHAVLYVRDAAVAANFYRDVLGMETVAEMPGAAFLRCGGNDNHHDLGLFSIGASAPGPEGRRVGLYHLAWEVPSIHDLAAARAELQSVGALVGESDHGVSKSLYARDPDGNEFEILWSVPREEWGDAAHDAMVAPLDLAREVARHG
jgi:catechol-2,3-dioxygenase